MGKIENYKILGKDLALSIGLSLLLLLILSIVLSLTNVSEGIMGISIIFISSFSVLVGAFLAIKKIKEKGIVFGSILGFTYITSGILNGNFGFTLSVLYMFLGGIIGGAIGGILGVNLK